MPRDAKKFAQLRMELETKADLAGGSLSPSQIPPDLLTTAAHGVHHPQEAGESTTHTHAGSHPDLAAHDTLGLATQAELDTHAAAADPHTGYLTEAAHGGVSPAGHHTAFVQADHDGLPNPHHSNVNDHANVILTHDILTPHNGFPGGTTNFLRADGTFAAPPGGGGGMTTLKKTADQTINAGAGVFIDITGLTFPVVAGVDYAFHFYITFQSASTATGWKAGVNCPAGTLDFWAQSDVISNGAAGVATHTERHNTVRDDMTLLTVTITQAVDLAVRIEGRYKCTANGTFAARFANELASNTQIVVQKGSWGWYF